VDELTGAQVQEQAEALAAYAAKGGAVSRWLDSKDFAEGDRRRVLLAWAALWSDDERGAA
jgi:hypothetical protein